MISTLAFHGWIVALARSNGKRNVTVWRPSICLSVQSFLLTVIERRVHTHRDVPGASCDAASVHFRPIIKRIVILVAFGSVCGYPLLLYKM